MSKPVIAREAPYSLELERAILGSMLLEAQTIERVVEILSAEDFYDIRHRHIARAIIELFKKGESVDALSLADLLKQRGQLEQIGGMAYLSTLVQSVDSTLNVERYARIVAEKALFRKLIEKTSLILNKAYDPNTNIFELLDQAETEIFNLTRSISSQTTSSLKGPLVQAWERLEAIHKKRVLTGVPSGFPELDELTGGWQAGDFIVIAARPSMGKTAFALNLAVNAALYAEPATPVAVFSLEMSSDQIAQRLLTSVARVNAHAARTGKLLQKDWRKLALAFDKLEKAPIFIDDSSFLNVLDLRAKCRRLKAEHNVGLIIVDYLQLMQPTGVSRKASREQEIAYISRFLKGLAKELGIPIIALSQLSRAVETRGGDKRPQLSDIRESGSIQQDADVVLFIYRAERYGILIDDMGNPTEGIAEIIIGKQRNGPVGTVQLAFVDEYASFENLAKDDLCYQF